MRVIAGKYKGAKLETPETKDFRPTTGKTKEALFSILSSGEFIKEDGLDVLNGATVVELFSGTGALSIEALSRGADFVVMVDENPDHIAIAKKNIDKLKLSKNSAFIRCNATQLPKAKQQCDIAFIDPPYSLALAEGAIKSLRDQGWLKDGSILVIETSKNESINLPDHCELISERLYGKCKLTFLRWLSKSIN